MASRAPQKRAFGAKQVIFACMLALVVCILAFAVGIVIGRGSPAPPPGAPGGPAAASPAGPSGAPDVVMPGEPMVDDEPTADALQEVTYPERLAGAAPAPEPLRALPLRALPLPAAAPDPAPAPEMAPAVDPLPRPAPPPDPYTLQVAVVRAAAAAEAIAGRLLQKGFPAYVVEPGPDSPADLYRVRVGRYADHDEAQRIQQRLVREEQLAPWITR